MTALIVAGVAAATAAALGAVKIMNAAHSTTPYLPQSSVQIATPNPEARLAKSKLPEYGSPDSYSGMSDPRQVLTSPGGSKSKRRGGPVREDGLIPRVGDPMRYAYVDTCSPGYADQDWQNDCGVFGSCPNNPMNSQGRPPLEDQYLGNAVGELGDYLPGLQTESRRDAEVELNDPPHPTRRFADYGLMAGEPLEPKDIPYGATPATDKEFWGPTVWEAERPHKLPSYLFNSTMELNGKEINRPMDTYFSDFDQLGDEADVGFANGMSSGRTPDVRLMAANRYSSFVTTKGTDEKKFMPPTATASRGMGMPPTPAERSIGARVIHVFNAFMPWKGASAGTAAPPELPAITLPAATRRTGTYEERRGVAIGPTSSYGPEEGNVQQGGRMNQRLPFNYWVSTGNLPPGGGTPAGPDTNPYRGGVIRRIGTRYNIGKDQGGENKALPGVWNTMGNAGFHVGGVSGTDTNPPEGGYHYTTRVRTTSDSDNSSSRGSAQGSGPILLFDMLTGGRQRKDTSGRAEYQAPASGHSQYGGVEIAGDTISNRRPNTWFAFPLIGRSGGGSDGGKPSPRSLWTIGGNTLKGVRGGDWDDSPPLNIGDEAVKSSLFDNIIGKRNEEELDDLFSVTHS